MIPTRLGLHWPTPEVASINVAMQSNLDHPIEHGVVTTRKEIITFFPCGCLQDVPSIMVRQALQHDAAQGIPSAVVQGGDTTNVAPSSQSSTDPHPRIVSSRGIGPRGQFNSPASCGNNGGLL